MRAARNTGVIVLIAMTIVLTCLPGCNRKDEQRTQRQRGQITIAVSPWPASAAIFVASEKGYFRDEGLDVVLQSHASGHLALDAVLTGKADFATAAETPIARAAINGKPLAITATLSTVDRAMLVIARRDRNIKGLDDLKGKKVGVTYGSTAEFFLHIYLTTSSVDPKTVRIVNIAADKIVAALMNGEADAVVTWPPYTDVLQSRLGGNGVVLEEPGLFTLTWNLVVVNELPRRDPDAITRVLRAVVRANRFIAEQPSEARAITAKNIGIDIREIDGSWKNYNMKASLDQSLILNLEDQARWMLKRKAGRAGRIPNFMDFIYADGLKAADPDAVKIAGK